MDVDVRYPRLSSLAQLHRKTLKNIGENAIPKHGTYLGFGECCYQVLHDYPRWGDCDVYNYLHTLDEFVSRIPANTPTRRKLWDKITDCGNAFLNAVVEAAWALYFWDNGYLQVCLEVPFDPSGLKSEKDADVVVTIDGMKHWLDATSIQPSESEFPPMPQGISFGPIEIPEEVITKLADKAREKYQDKFEEAVHSGFFKDEVLGVLLCVLKFEKQVDFLTEFNLSLPPPKGLLDNEKPGLNLVWVHTLRASRDSDILRPSTIAKWSTT